MTLEEVIKDFEYGIELHQFGPVRISIEAAELGIEALKRLKNARQIGRSIPAELLPGETEE